VPTFIARPIPFRRRRRFAPRTAPAALAAGAASFVSSGPGGISVEATAPTGGSGALSYQWERNEDGGAYGDLAGQTALACADTTATTPAVAYRFRCKQTRGVDTVTTDAVLAYVYSGGSLAGGGVRFMDMTGGFRG
jgi:hypothetical protein